MKISSPTPVSRVILLLLFFSLGTSLISAQHHHPLSGKWKGWGSMIIKFENETIKGTYSDTYEDDTGFISMWKSKEGWTGTWEEKSIKRKGVLFNITISEDGKTIKGLYSVFKAGASSNGSKYPSKENIAFHWTLIQKQDPKDIKIEMDIEEEETPQFDICQEKHKVNIKSTMWIADMDLEEEMAEYIAFLDRNKVPEEEYARRIAVFNAFALGTNTFPDDGSHAEPADPSERLFRIASELNIDVEVRDGEIIRARAAGQPYTRGGYEGVGLYGSSNGRVLNELVTPERYTCRYIIYGDPHWLANLALNHVELRTSTRIWHYIEIEITPYYDCSIKTRARFRASSAYPSHRLWIDDEEVNYSSNRNSVIQGNVIQLWEKSEVDIEIESRKTDFPANDFAFLLRFMGNNIKQWVRPRFNPQTLLEWP